MMMKRDDRVVTWQQAEDAMIAAFDYLFALPDADRAFLKAGSRSCWPQVVRSLRDGDYGEGQGVADTVAPSPQLSRRMLGHVERMLLNEGAAGMAVPEGHRSLVGRVLVMQRWGQAWQWSDVWRAEKGTITDLRTGQPRKTTSDAMRKAYERGIGRVAMRMETLGMGPEDGL